MVVTCPACSARYKLDETKIKGRGARITCPKCAHKFVVYKDNPAPAKKAAPIQAAVKTRANIPADFAGRDFSAVGLLFTVRKSIGLTYDITSYSMLERFRSDGRIEDEDEITWDRQTWTALSEIDDMEDWFWNKWARAAKGEIRSRMQVGGEEDEDEEDDEDAPTSIIGTGSNLADEIRKAVLEQGSSMTETQVPDYAEDSTARRENEAVLAEETPAPAPHNTASPPANRAPASGSSNEGGESMSPPVMIGIALVVLVAVVGILYATGTFGG